MLPLIHKWFMLTLNVSSGYWAWTAVCFVKSCVFYVPCSVVCCCSSSCRCFIVRWTGHFHSTRDQFACEYMALHIGYFLIAEWHVSPFSLAITTKTECILSWYYLLKTNFCHCHVSNYPCREWLYFMYNLDLFRDSHSAGVCRPKILKVIIKI